jgi:hypothetical protein
VVHRSARAPADFLHPSALTDRWAAWGFEEEPPNATLSGSGAVVELTDPVQPTSREVSFRTKPVRGGIPGGELGNQALFVDFIEEGTETYDPLECLYWVEGDPYEGATGITFDDETDRSTYGLNCHDYDTLVADMMEALDDPAKTEERSFALEVKIGSEDSWSCAGRVSGTLKNGSMALIQSICKNVQHGDYPQPGFTLFPRN